MARPLLPSACMSEAIVKTHPQAIEDEWFRDRTEAGRRLAASLEAYRGRPGVVVLGLPRGGVVVAAEVARALGLPLDVMIARKIGAPRNSELGIGAVAEDAEPVLNADAVRLTGASPAFLEASVRRAREEIDRRRQLFRRGRPLSLPKGCTALVIDDGIATGATLQAAVRCLRDLGVGRIVVAVPVAPPDALEELRGAVDELVAVSVPLLFWSVGGFYRRFPQVTDQEVADLVAEAEREGRGPTAAEIAVARGPR